MVVSQVKFQGPQGANATQANTGAVVATQLAAGATAVFDSAVKGTGSGFGVKVTSPPSATGIAYLRFQHTVTTSAALAFYIWLQRPLTNPTTNVCLARVRSGSGAALSLNVNTTGSMVPTDSVGAFLTSATAAQLDAAGIPPGGMFKWLFRGVGSTSTTGGQYSCRIVSPTNVQAGTVSASSTANLTTSGVLYAADCGFSNSATTANYSSGFADIQFADYAGTSLPPEYNTDMSSNAAPTANAGPDQTGVEPWQVVTLNGSGSTDSDGTIASYAWTQLSGPAVTIVNANTATPTFVAPAVQGGTSVNMQLTVTDNGGLTSTDSVLVTVLSPNFYIAGASTWNGVNIQAL